jgi:PPOX class probable F420-dependent enzyme
LRSIRELPEWARELVATRPVAHLGLIDAGGRPRVLPITFATVGDELWSAVDHKPKRDRARELARVRWLRANPAAAITVDLYSDDWARLAWVQVLGEVAVHGEPAAGVIAGLADKYDQYRDRPPGGPYLRLEPRRCICWRVRD